MIFTRANYHFYLGLFPKFTDILSVGSSHESGIFGRLSLTSWQEKLVVLDTNEDDVSTLFEEKFLWEMMIVWS